jgi:excisionase family DNA binding protein
MFMLGLGKTKLYELLGDGELEAIRVGRRTLVLRASIDALVERHRSNRN